MIRHYHIPSKLCIRQRQFEQCMQIPMMMWPSSMHDAIMTIIRHFEKQTKKLHWKAWVARTGLTPNYQTRMEDVWRQVEQLIPAYQGSDATWIGRLQLMAHIDWKALARGPQECYSSRPQQQAEVQIAAISSGARWPKLAWWNVTSIASDKTEAAADKLCTIRKLSDDHIVAVAEHGCRGTRVKEVAGAIDMVDFYALEVPEDRGMSSIGIFVPRHLGWKAQGGIRSMVDGRAGVLVLTKGERRLVIIAVHFPNGDTESFFFQLQAAIRADGLQYESAANQQVVMLTDANAAGTHHGRAAGHLTYHDTKFAEHFQKYMSEFAFTEVVGQQGPQGATWRRTGNHPNWSIIDRAWIGPGTHEFDDTQWCWRLGPKHLQTQHYKRSDNHHMVCILQVQPTTRHKAVKKANRAPDKIRDECFCQHNAFNEQVKRHQLRILEEEQVLPAAYFDLDQELAEATRKIGKQWSPEHFGIDVPVDDTDDHGNEPEVLEDETGTAFRHMECPALDSLQQAIDQGTLPDFTEYPVQRAIDRLTKLAHDAWKRLPRRKRPKGTGPAMALRQIIARQQTEQVTIPGDTFQWIASTGVRPVSWNKADKGSNVHMTRDNCRTWLARLNAHEQHARERCRPGWTHADPPDNRPKKPTKKSFKNTLNNHGLGKMKNSVSYLLDESNKPHTDPGKRVEMLGNTRPRWGQTPNILYPEQQKALDLYVARSPHRPYANIKAPNVRQASDAASRFKISAVGGDQVGYGFWTMLPIEIGLLLLRYFQMAVTAPITMWLTTPIPVDITVFIPKYEGANKPEPFRPLQLPDVIRRKMQDLFVMVMAATVYNNLSNQHAAGDTQRDCSHCVMTNHDALDHGSSPPTHGRKGVAPAPMQEDQLAHLIGNEAYAALNDIESLEDEETFLHAQGMPTESYPDGRVQRFLQTFDQMKAYENLCVLFLLRVLQAMGAPAWVTLVVTLWLRPRQVRILVERYLGPLIDLARSLGMGGPAAPMLWDVAYDVIVSFVAGTPGVICSPTYADDMGMVARSLRAIAATQFLMLWFQWVAGLQVAQHKCAHLLIQVHSGHCAEVAQALRDQLEAMWVHHRVIHIKSANTIWVTTPMAQFLAAGMMQRLRRWGAMGISTANRMQLKTPAGRWRGEPRKYTPTRHLIRGHTMVQLQCACGCKHDVCPRVAPTKEEIAQATKLPAGIWGWGDRAPSLGVFVTSSEDWRHRGTRQGRPVVDRAPKQGATQMARALRSELSTMKAIKGMRERLVLKYILGAGFADRIYTWNCYLVSKMSHVARCLRIQPAQTNSMRRIGREFLSYRPGYSWTVLTDMQVSLGIGAPPLDPQEVANTAITMATIRHYGRRVFDDITDTNYLHYMEPWAKASESYRQNLYLATRRESRMYAHIRHATNMTSGLSLWNEQNKPRSQLSARIRNIFRTGGCPACRYGRPKRGTPCPGCKGPRLLALVTRPLRARATTRRCWQTKGEEFDIIRQQPSVKRKLRLQALASIMEAHATQRRMRWTVQGIQTEGQCGPMICCHNCGTPRPRQQTDWRGKGFCLPGGLRETLSGHARAICQACLGQRNQALGIPQWITCLNREIGTQRLLDTIHEFLSTEDASSPLWRAKNAVPEVSGEVQLPPCTGEVDYERLDALAGRCPLCQTAENSAEHMKHWCPVTISALTVILEQSPPGGGFQIHEIPQPRQVAALTLQGIMTTIAAQWRDATEDDSMIARWRQAMHTILTQTYMALPDTAKPPQMPESWQRWLGQYQPIHIDRLIQWPTHVTEECTCTECRSQCAQGVVTGVVGHKQVWWNSHGHPHREGYVLQSRQATTVGTPLATIRARQEGSECTTLPLWPIQATGVGSLPAPRAVDPLCETPTAGWDKITCQQCNYTRWELRSTRIMPKFAEITVPYIKLEPHKNKYTLVIYFDGGAQGVGTKNVIAGAGISAWLVSPEGRYIRLYELASAVPAGKHSADAEAHGGSIAVTIRPFLRKLAQEMGFQLESREIIRGDNTAVIGYLTGDVRIKATHMRRLIQQIQTFRVTQGDFIAQHVPRALNAHADRQAGIAIKMQKSAQQSLTRLKPGKEDTGEQARPPRLLSKGAARPGTLWHHRYGVLFQGPHRNLRMYPTRTIQTPSWWETHTRQTLEQQNQSRHIAQDHRPVYIANYILCWAIDRFQISERAANILQQAAAYDKTGAIATWLQHTSTENGQSVCTQLYLVDFELGVIRPLAGGPMDPVIPRGGRYLLMAGTSEEWHTCSPTDQIFWTIADKCCVLDTEDHLFLQSVKDEYIRRCGLSERQARSIFWAATFEQTTLLESMETAAVNKQADNPEGMEVWHSQPASMAPKASGKIMDLARRCYAGVAQELRDRGLMGGEDGTPEYIELGIRRGQVVATMEWIRSVKQSTNLTPSGVYDDTVMWEIGAPTRILEMCREHACQRVFHFAGSPQGEYWHDVEEDLQKIRVHDPQFRTQQHIRPIPTLTVAQETFAGSVMDLPHKWRRKDGPLRAPQLRPADFRDMARYI